MDIVVDIDQTISTGHDGGSIDNSMLYYRSLGIVIPPNITNLYNLFQLPDVMKIHITLPGSVAGVTALSSLGTIHYFTIRKHTDPQINEQIQNITRTWLAENSFPYSQHAVFCRSSLDKLIKLYELDAERLILIDDRFPQIFDAIDMLQERNKTDIVDSLRKRLTIVAFGTDTVPTISNGFQCLALPAWKHIEDIIPSFLVA